MKLIQQFKIIVCLAIVFTNTKVFSQNIAVVSVPLIQQANYFFLTVKVNQKDSLNFIFDTGAEFTVLNESSADGTIVGNTRKATVSGGTGNTSAKLYKKQTLQIGTLVLDNIKIITIPFDHFFLIQGIKVDGIIGQDLMDRFIIETNVDDGIFNLYDKNTFAYKGTEQPLPILNVKGERSGAIAIEITLKNGKKVPGKFVLDTGSGSCFSLNVPFAADNEIVQSMPTVYTKLTYGASANTMLSKNGRFETIQIGRHTITNCTASIKDANKGTYLSKSRSGVVGNQILSCFNAVYDFINNKLYLPPAKKFNDPFIAQANGMSIEYADTTAKNIIVKLVNENSPAGRAGIHEGDEILELNSVKISEIGLQKLLVQLNIPNKQIELLIKQKTGDIKKIMFVTKDII